MLGHRLGVATPKTGSHTPLPWTYINFEHFELNDQFLYHFSFSPFYKIYRRWNTDDVIWNLLKLYKIKEKNGFFHIDFNELVIFLKDI